MRGWGFLDPCFVVKQDPGIRWTRPNAVNWFMRTCPSRPGPERSQVKHVVSLCCVSDEETPGLNGFLHVIVRSAQGFKESASMWSLSLSLSLSLSHTLSRKHSHSLGHSLFLTQSSAAVFFHYHGATKQKLFHQREEGILKQIQRPRHRNRGSSPTCSQPGIPWLMQTRFAKKSPHGHTNHNG